MSMKLKIKKFLCLAGLSTILINLSGSNHRNSIGDQISASYNVNYDSINYLDDNLNNIVSNTAASFDNYTSYNVPFEPVYSYIPQGLTATHDYLLVSSYDYYTLKNSIISVIDHNGNVVNTCELDIVAHVGGIAYDEDHNLLWVASSKGLVNAYRFNKVLECEKVKPVYKDVNLGYDLINHRNNPAISYLSYNNGKLYVGNYTYEDHGILKEYNINEDGKTMYFDLNKTYNAPTKVQGVTFFNKDDKDYIIFSRSGGCTNPSILQMYSFNGNEFYDNDKNSVVFETPKMMEQIACLDDTLYSVYESSAFPYSIVNNGGTDSIYASNVSQLIKK